MNEKVITPLAILIGILALVGCSTVPESVQKTISERQKAITQVHNNAAKYAEQNKIKVQVNLPPGSYEIPENFELASIEIPQDITAATLAAVEAQNNIPIPENVAITALRVTAPLLGFGIGAWQNVEIHKSNADMFNNLGAGVFGLSETVIQNPVQPVIVGP